MNKTVSVNFLGRKDNQLDLSDFVKMYSNEIKSLRYQLWRMPHNIDQLEKNQQFEAKLDRAIKSVELVATELFNHLAVDQDQLNLELEAIQGDYIMERGTNEYHGDEDDIEAEKREIQERKDANELDHLGEE